MYPSNWELSAARAASVARLFAINGVAADRLGIIGWGEVRPLADNATAEGRNQNRRVVVVVMGNQKVPQRSYSNPGDVDEAQGLSASVIDPLPANALPHGARHRRQRTRGRPCRGRTGRHAIRRAGGDEACRRRTRANRCRRTY